MGYGVMFTVLDDFRDNYGITESKLGLIVSIGFITGFFSQILFAPQADKGHAKKLVMTAPGSMLCALFQLTRQVLTLPSLQVMSASMGGSSLSPLTMRASLSPRHASIRAR
jgi:MFS family permease